MMDTPTVSRGPKRDWEETSQRRSYGYPEDLSMDDDDFDVQGDRSRQRGRGGVRIAGFLPKAVWGRVALGFGALLLVGGTVAAAYMGVNRVLLHDEHFVLDGADS